MRKPNNFINNKVFIFSLVLLFSINSFSQKFELGQKITPNLLQFELLDFSPSTGVTTYQYIGIKDWYLYNRRVGEIIVGTKNGIIVTTVYNLIPEKEDEDVPKITLELIQKKLSQPLIKLFGGDYGANIDNMTISLQRSYGFSLLAFKKDRIMYFTTIKYSILKQ